MVITEAKEALSTSFSSVSALGNHPLPSTMSPLFLQPFTADVPVEAFLFAFDTPCKSSVQLGFSQQHPNAMPR